MPEPQPAAPTVPASRDIAVGFLILLLAAAGGVGLLPEPIGRDLAKRWAYWGLIPVTLLLAACVLVLARCQDVRRQHLAIPSALFLLCLAYYILIGTADHWLQVRAGAPYVYLSALFSGYQYLGLALAGWLGGYLLFGRVRVSAGEEAPRLPSRSAWQWACGPLRAVSLFWTLLGSIAFAVFYFHVVGGFPVFRGVAPNADPNLRQLLFGAGHTLSVVAFNATTFSILTSGLCLVCFPRRRLLPAVQLAVSVGWFALWGARVFVALPMMIVLVLYLSERHWNLRRIAFVLAALFALGAVYGLVRNRAFFQIDFENRTVLQRLADLHIGPEFRDMLGVADHLDELQKEYDPDWYLQGVFLTAFPQRVLELLGMNKDALFSEEGIGSDWLVARVTRGYDWGAVRPGIIGQTLMACGPAGIVVVFVLYGVGFAWLDRLHRRLPADSPGKLVAAGAAVIFAYSVLATTHGAFAKWWYFLYGCAITAVLAAHHREGSREPS